jgi:acyl-CoA reductase-like NAD-dependent aldehyde dehydrogenase
MLSAGSALQKQSGCDLDVFDSNMRARAVGTHAWTPEADVLGALMPGNHPIVNSLWLLAFCAKYPVVIRPSFEDPFTPARLVESLVRAGASARYFGLYPCRHDDAFALAKSCGKAIIFGGSRVERIYGGLPWANVFGPGHSKIVVADPWVDDIEGAAKRIAQTALFHSGRACISTSAVITTRKADAIGEAVARNFDQVAGEDPERDGARLAVHTDARAVATIKKELEAALNRKGVRDLSAPRPLVEVQGGLTIVPPRVFLCESPSHPLFGIELPFPFVTVAEAAEAEIPRLLGKTLACTVLSDSLLLRRAILRTRGVEKVYGPTADATRMDFGDPHQGFLLDFLYRAKVHRE